MNTVIAAIATPAAAAGIGVVRISGDGAIALADRLFRPLGKGKSLSALDGYTALYGHAYDADGDSASVGILISVIVLSIT